MIPRFSDHAANERTYLAWVRTAIAIMAFGFLIERFDIFLAYTARAAARPVVGLHMRATELTGLLLIIFGALIILLATLRYLRYRKCIASDDVIPYGGNWSEKLLAGILVVMGLFLVVYVGQELVAFA